MNEKDRPAFSEAIGAMMVTFQVEVTKMLLEGYWLALNHLSIEELQRGVYECMRRCKFRPTPAEIIEHAQVHVDLEAITAQAWGDVLNAVPQGAWKHVDFQDKAINAVIRNMGGWSTFLDRFRNPNEEKWARIEFERKYKAFLTNGISEEQARPLAGLSEMQNGFEPVPVLIPCDAYRLALCQKEERRSIPFQELPAIPHSDAIDISAFQLETKMLED